MTFDGHDVDELLRLIRFGLFDEDRRPKVKALAMRAGEGDSRDVVSECLITAVENLSRPSAAEVALSTVVLNSVDWTLSRLLTEVSRREQALRRLSEFRPETEPSIAEKAAEELDLMIFDDPVAIWPRLSPEELRTLGGREQAEIEAERRQEALRGPLRASEPKTTSGPS